MKNLIKTDFDNLYEELSTINLDNYKEVARSLPYKDLLKKLDSGEVTWNSVKAIAQGLKQIFDSKGNWHYQFQLMYNAWVTESDALEQINNKSSELRKAIENAIKPIKLADKYIFNELPVKGGHENFTYEAVQKLGQYSDSDYPDLITENADADTIKSIEVKATTAKGYGPGNFHEADLVIVYSLDENIIKVLTKNDNYTIPIVTKVPTKVANDCIIVRKDKAVMVIRARHEPFINKATASEPFEENPFKQEFESYNAYGEVVKNK